MRLDRIEDLDESKVVAEPVHRLTRARVVLADYPRLRADFPQLASAERGAIDAWLLRHAGVMSTAQVAQTVVNTPISIDGGTVTAFRPPRYGRAAVVSVRSGDEPDGLLDLKGIGVAPGVSPRPVSHGDGLLSLDVLLQEVLNQRLVEAVLRHAGEDVTGVPVYAALDTGFDSRADWPRAAGILVRGAHRRSHGESYPAHGSVAHYAQTAIELLLRSYGVTTTTWSIARDLGIDDGGALEARVLGRPVHGMDHARLAPLWDRVGRVPTRLYGANVQTTREVSAQPLRARLVDFGHYRFRERFAAPLLGTVHDRPLTWGGMLTTSDPLYVQPDPALALCADVCGCRGLTEVDSDPVIEPDLARSLGVPGELRVSKIRALALQLVAGWRRGELDPDQIDRALDDFAAAATRRWRAVAQPDAGEERHRARAG